ncbi:hypothetical protein [Cetobacterium sp.]|uniref:hypothetical protein n=1 Tax=Cetobacterium sp. TaxID=2071632 RepID=UPI003F2EC9F0
MKKKIFLMCLTFLLFQKGYSKELKKQPLTELVESSNNQSDLEIEENREAIEQAYLEENFSQIENGVGIYDLYINGEGVSKTYPIYKMDENTYVSLYDFIELLGLRDFVKKDNVFTVKIGIDGVVREINFTKKYYIKEDKNREIVTKKFYTNEIIEKNGVVFIEKNTFQEIFDSILTEAEEKMTLNMTTKFDTPRDVEVILQNRFNNIEKEKESVEILYESKKELFTLGNIRLNVTQNFDKTSEENGFKKDWTGNTEYSGGLLYGNFTTSYDIKNKDIGAMELYYNDIWKGHSLKFGSYPAGNQRELGLRFEKERSYYTKGREVIIKERVPIGSVVELIYLGTAIDIQHAEDGYVEFTNIGVQLDRKYTLKIYTPTGEIINKDINTSVTYNQQNKGEIEYSVDLRQDKVSGDYRGNLDVYYGVTQNLTLSTGFSRNSVDFGNDGEKDYKFDDRVRAEGIYTDYLFAYPYTVSLNGERALSKYKSGEKSLEDLYSLGGLGTITINDLKLEYKDKHNGEYFDEKRVTSYDMRYDLFDGIVELTSNIEFTENYDGKRERKHEYGLNMGHSFGNYSIMGEYNRDTDKRNIYRGDAYYNGFEKLSVRLSGEYTQEIGDKKDAYEGTLSVRNKGWSDKFDFSVEAKYKNTGESALGLSFSIKVDDWFVLDGSADRVGNQRLGVGIDKVISLKNPLKKITDINSSRVRVRTFLDSNRNNRWDNGEELLPEMKVLIGAQEIITDIDGIGYIYDLSNGIEYEVKATLNRPEYNLSYSAMKVLPKHVSEIDVDIPVQPLVTLEGYISLEGLDIPEDDAINVYNDIIVTVMDEKGKELEHTIPEDNGGFQVSGLFSEKYRIKIQYLGDKEGIEEKIETVQLAYGAQERNRYVFNLLNRYSKVEKGVNKWDLLIN